MRTAGVWGVLMFVAACGGPAPSPDAFVDRDARADDAGGTSRDAAKDALDSTDASVPTDVAMALDAGTDAPTAFDAGTDAATTPDAGTDAAAPVDAAVLSCGSGGTCATGHCDDGVCWSTPETAQPYHLSRCDLFAADPPPEVWSFVRARGMIWGGGGRTVVRHDGTHWILSFDPLALTTVSGLLGSDSTVVVVTNVGTYRRDDDVVGWVLLPAPSASAIVGRALQGSHLYAVDGAGALFVHDGTGWATVPAPATTGRPTLVAASAVAVYLATNASELARWDGTAWTIHRLPSSLPTPPPITALDVGDESSVFVNGNVHFDGSAFVTTTGRYVMSVAPGHVIGASLSRPSLMVGDGTGVFEWTGTAWTPLTLPTPPAATATFALQPYAVSAIPDGFVYRTYLNTIVHDATGERELWVDGPQRVVADSLIGDMRFTGWDGILRLTSGAAQVIPGSEHQYPIDGARAWSDGSIVYVYGGTNNEYVGAFDGSAVSTIIPLNPTSPRTFDVYRARGVTDFDYSWRMTSTHLSVHMGTTDQALSTGCGSTAPTFGFAAQRAIVSLCFSASTWTVSVFDGTSTSTGTAPAGMTRLWTLGTPPATSAYLGDGTNAYMAYDGSSWTSGAFPSGVFVTTAIGPSPTHPVALLSATRGGSASRLGWLDASGSWRTSAAYGAVQSPAVTDGTSVVWSNPSRFGGYVTRCRLDP